jgi:hypothetical protein
MPQRLHVERGLLRRQVALRHGEKRVRRVHVERRLPSADPLLQPERGVRELPAEQRLREHAGDPLLQPGSNAVHPVPLEERLPRGPDVQGRSLPLRIGHHAVVALRSAPETRRQQDRGAGAAAGREGSAPIPLG